MYKNKSISVVMPAYNEEVAIGSVIRNIKKIKIVDDIIVVNNNSTDSTAIIARKLGCKIINEKKQGYGYACITGLKNAGSELIVLMEADNTFDPVDIKKLLKHIEKYDMVLGSRVQSHKKGAVMPWYVRLGNHLLGKLIDLLWLNKYGLDDVGSTFRVIKKSALDKIIHKLKISGPDFAPESTVEAIKAELKIKQIPVKYLTRKGQAKLTKSWVDSLKIGLLHFFLIINRRIT